MAEQRIPNLIAIRYLDGYVYCTTADGPKAIEGYVGWKEVDVFSPLTKIVVETAKIDNKYVNLRFCCNNRYWALDDEWLAAKSEQPDENKSNGSCTLFEPIVKDDKSFHLIHVQSGKYVLVDSKRSGYLHLGSSGDNCELVAVDLNELAMLPKHVTFKGDNGKYLESASSDGNLKFSSGDENAEATAYEVTMNPHGFLLIMSKNTGKYWRANPEKITADNQLDEAGKGKDDATTLFWSVKLDDKTIALRNSASGKFCHRDSDDALSASVPTITREARLQLKELVLERQIVDIIYHMDKARIYDQKLVVLGEESAANETQEKATLDIKVTYENTSCYSFKRRMDFKLDVKINFKTSIPFIFEDGHLNISAHASASQQWNEETKKSVKQEATYKAVVPPKSSVKVKYVATEGKCDVPFSYTQRDKLSRDGSIVTTAHTDGVFTGVNYFCFKFMEVNLDI